MIDTSKIYKSKSSGEYRITKELPKGMLEVRFLVTGFRRAARKDNALQGRVKDPMLPKIYGTGFIGMGRHKVAMKGRCTKAYSVWVSMLQRCYSKRFHDKHPTYKDCSALDEWHNFQNFAEWFERNYIEGYQLDKDIKIPGNKLYSPSTCMFVSQADNVITATAKSYRFVLPQGGVIDIHNLMAYCKKSGLNYGDMCSVHSGKRRHHKGITKAP